MANGDTPETARNHVRFIVCCITLLGIVCSIGGTVLVFKGYSGELLFSGVIGAISGLCGYLGAGRPQTPQPDITVSGQPPKVEVSQQTTEVKS